MIRRMIVLAAVCAATLPLGGCVVSLFSSSRVSESRLSSLEARMDHVEHAIESR